MMPETFTPDRAIIGSVTPDNIVSYAKLRSVKIRLTGDAPKFAKDNLMQSKQTSRMNRDGSCLFSIPEVPAEVVVPWILAQRGDAVPLEPPDLVETVRRDAEAIMRRLTARDPAGNV